MRLFEKGELVIFVPSERAFVLPDIPRDEVVTIVDVVRKTMFNEPIYLVHTGAGQQVWLWQSELRPCLSARIVAETTHADV